MGYLTEEDINRLKEYSRAVTPIQPFKPLTKMPAPAVQEKSEFMTGSLYQKIFDPLMAGQYAIAGLGRELLLPSKGGIVEGIKHRASWVDTFLEAFPYEPTQSWANNFIQQLARAVPGTIADIVLDPMWIFPPAKIAKMLGITKLASPVTKLVERVPVLKATKEKFGEMFVWGYGWPEQYKAIKEAQAIREAADRERAYLISKPISKLSKKEQQQMTDWARGVEGADIPVKLKSMALSAMEEYGEYEARLVRVGALSESDLIKYRNLTGYKRYAGATLYETYELQKAGKIPILRRLAKIEKADLSRLKEIKVTDDTVKEAMGEIKEFGYITARTLDQLARTTSMLEMFDSISKDRRIFSPLFAEARKGWLKLPKTRTLGKISGGYVHPAIYKDLATTIREVSKGERLARTGLGTWKWFKVIGNPATHFRNLYSNVILADMGGLPFYRADVYYDALKEMVRKGTYYKELKANSAILTDTFAHRDIMDLLSAFEKSTSENMLGKLQDISKYIFEKGGNIYQAEEQWAKLALYMWKRKQGLSITQAVKEAEKWLFNYWKVPSFIEVLRGGPGGFSGVLGVLSAAYPFITFSYKAIPRVVETAIMKTPRLTKWAKMMKGVEKLSPEQETQREKEVLSEYINSGMWMKIPFKDNAGRSLYLDLNYILPWGDIGEIGHTLMPSNPVYMILRDLATNTNTYMTISTGQRVPIVKDGTHEDVAWKQVAAYILRAILPSLTPFPFKIEGRWAGGYSYEKLIQAILKKPDYRGRTRDLFWTFVGTVLGLKTTPIDAQEERMWRERERTSQLREVNNRINSLMQRMDLTFEEKLRLKKAYDDKIKEIYSKFYSK